MHCAIYGSNNDNFKLDVQPSTADGYRRLNKIKRGCNVGGTSSLLIDRVADCSSSMKKSNRCGYLESVQIISLNPEGWWVDG